MLYDEPIHGSANYDRIGVEAIVTESTLYETINRAFPDGVPQYKDALRGRGFRSHPDSLAHFVIRECYNTANLGGGAFEPFQAAYAIDRAMDDLRAVKRALNNLGTATYRQEVHESDLDRARRALVALLAER